MFKKIRKRVDRFMDNVEEKITIAKEVLKDKVVVRKIGVLVTGLGIALVVSSYVG